MFLKLQDLLECSARVARQGGPRAMCYSGGGTELHWPRSPGTLPGSSLMGSRGASEPRLKKTFSNAAIHVMHKLFLKLKNFEK